MAPKRSQRSKKARRASTAKVQPAAAVQPRPCVICGETKATREHVWPRWLIELTGREGQYQIGVGDDPADWQSWETANFPLAPRVLCEPCNNRLGRLDGWAAGVVRPMVDGQLRRLKGDEQASLAQWFYKTGLMVATQMAATSTNPESSTLPRAHYSDLESSLDLPPASMVWIGRVTKPLHRRAQWVQRFVWHDNRLQDGPQAEGYSILVTFAGIVGLVAVLDTRQSPESQDNPPPFQLGDPVGGKLSRIWPTSQHYGVAWPTPLPFTAPEVVQLATVFRRIAEQRAAGGSGL